MNLAVCGLPASAYEGKPAWGREANRFLPRLDELRSIQKPAIFVEQVDGLRGWTRLALSEITLELQGEELPEVFSMASRPRNNA